MWIEDGQWPWPHHPVAADGDGQLVVDENVSVEVFQVRPLTVDQAAAWCGGTVVLINGGPAVLVGGAAAGLGDYLVDRGGIHAVPAGEFHSRWHPATS